MLYVTKTKMHKGRGCSKYPEDIEQLYISGIGWCWKEDVYDYLLDNPKSIAVNIHPFPYLIRTVSFSRESMYAPIRIFINMMTCWICRGYKGANPRPITF